MSSFRQARVEKLILQTVSGFIMKGEVKDPRVNSLLTLVNCKVSKDLAYADIGVSGYMDTAQLLKGVDGLNSAAGFLQAGLGRVMKTRNTPKLRFNMAPEIQEGFELSKKIDSLLSDKENTDASEDPTTGSDPTE